MRCQFSNENEQGCALFFLSSLFLPSCPTSPSSFLSSSSSFLLFLTLEPRRKRRFRKQKRSHSRVLERKDTRRRRNRSEKERERKRETKGGRVPVKEDSVSLFAGGLIRAQGHFYTEPSLILSHPHGDCPSFGFFSFFFHICHPVYFWPASPRIFEDCVATLILVNSISVMGDYLFLRILDSEFLSFPIVSSKNWD